MEEKLIAVPESLLTDIGDSIRAKRDITTPIPVPDMPLQIGLIESGEVPNDMTLFENMLIKNGFKLVEFAISEPSPNNYTYVYHGLGRIPTDLVYLCEDILTYNSNEYVMGYSFGSNINKDNKNNRTAIHYNNQVDSIFSHFLFENIGFSFLSPTLWNSTRNVDDQYIELRNQDGNNNTKMRQGNWKLFIR